MAIKPAEVGVNPHLQMPQSPDAKGTTPSSPSFPLLLPDAPLWVANFNKIILSFVAFCLTSLQRKTFIF